MAISQDDFDLDADFEASNVHADLADDLDDFLRGVVDEDDSPFTLFDVMGVVIVWLYGTLEGEGQDALANQARHLLDAFEALPLDRNYRKMNADEVARFHAAMGATRIELADCEDEEDVVTIH